MQEVIQTPVKNEPSKGEKFLRALKKQNGWLFVMPALIIMAVFTFYPIISALVTAFLEGYNGLEGAASIEGIGFGNFRDVVMSTAPVPADFVVCLENTLLFALISVPLSTLLALLISVALNSIKSLQKAYQTLFFLPYLTNSLAMGAVFATFFNIVSTGNHVETVGLFNNFLGLFGIEPINWINAYSAAFEQAFNPWAGRFVVIIFEIWSGLPFKILIIFSALQSVNKQYYDAAKVDGATKYRTLTKITVPLISPTLSYLLVTGIMGGLKSYSAIVGLFNQYMGPNEDYEMGTMVGYIYGCISSGATGAASAGSLILFAIIMVFTAINLWVSKKKVHY